MKFSERLQTLMNVYRINNVTLARGIGVDASLVSRWRNGDRVPKSRSSVPGDIAAFLSGMGMLQHDRQTLVQLLGVPCQTKEQTREAIHAWLKGQTPTMHVAMDPESPELVERLLSYLPQVFRAEARAPSGPVSLYPRVKKGVTSNHEMFKGRDGLRQAVINFMHIVLTNRTPGDVYIMQPAGDEWQKEDPAFEALYVNALRTAIQSGHTVHMVHPAPHGSALGPLLSTYMPLYATGRFFSYGRTGEAGADSPGIFVLKGHSAVISYELADRCYSVLFQGRDDIALFEGMVHAQMGRPLATACTKDSPLRFAELLIQLEDRPGALMSVKNSPDAVFLPENTLYKLLCAQLDRQNADRRLNAVARRRETLMTRLETQPWSIIIPMSVMDAILINGSCRLSGVELLTPRDVTLSGGELASYLKSILSMMESYPLLRVMFAEDCPQTNLTVKEGTGTFFVADTADAQPTGVYVGDLELCEALYRWFAARMRNYDGRDRKRSVALLTEAVEFLEL